MGRIAAENADRVIVTDDNTRSENPAAIRSAILAEARGAVEIGDRAEAIRQAIAGLKGGDVLLIAGKGHETGQIVGDRVVPFSDHEAVAAALQGKGPMSSLWTIDAVAAAMRAERVGPLPAELSGVSIDSRTVGKGDAFFAVQGENRDGHEFVDNALKAGAALAVVASNRRERFPDAPLLVVPDVLEALRGLGRAARARSQAQGDCRHGVGRQDRHQGSAAAGAFGRWRTSMLPLRRTTITGACRCRWRAGRQARNTRFLKSV